jgi:hypothetical protein
MPNITQMMKFHIHNFRTIGMVVSNFQNSFIEIWILLDIKYFDLKINA